MNPSPQETLRAACAEISQRLRMGESWTTEDALKKQPSLARDAGCVVELVYTEFVTLEELGMAPRSEAFLARFPAHREVLTRQFLVHELVSREDPASGRPRVVEPAAGASSGGATDEFPRVGDHQILERRGRGAAATVFRARHASLGRVVALKVFPARPADSSGLARPEEEARTLAGLQHPGIVQLYETGVTADGRDYFAMEWIAGENLAERLEAGLPGWRDAAVLIRTIAEAVHFAHGKGVVHRDLKPGNILLDANGAPKVGDFGMAGRMDGALDAGETGGGFRFQGTPGYLAPEQARRDGEPGASADVYSLGAILYHLLTGRPPFLSDTPLETIRQLLEDDPVDPRRLQPSVPRDLAVICMHCLARTPESRYRSAAELTADLNRFLAGKPILARPAPLWEHAWKWARRKPAPAALLALAVVAPLALYITGLWYVAYLREARDDADQQRRIAQNQSGRIREQLETQKHLAYALQVGRAHSLYRRNPSTALRLLDNESVCPPDLREFSWRLAHRLIPRARRVFSGGSLAQWSPGGDRLALGGFRSQLTIRNTGDWKVAVRADDPSLTATRSLAWSPDGERIATGNSTGKLTLWDAASGEKIADLPGHRGLLIGLDFSPDSRRLVSVGFRPGTARLWDLDAFSSRVLLESKGFLHGAAFSPGGRSVAVTGETVGVRVFDSSSGRQLRHIDLGDDQGSFLAFSPNGEQLAAGVWEQGVYLYDTRTWRKTGHLPAGLSSVRALDFSPGGALLATACQDTTLRIWDLATRREIQVRRGHDRVAWSVAFHPGGDLVATGGKDGSVRVWSTKPGPPNPEVILRAPARILSLGVDSPDGNLVALDATAGIQRPGRPALAGTGPQAFTAALSGDGRRAAFTLADGTLKLIDLSRPDAALFIQLGIQSEALAFSPSAEELAVGCRNGAVRLLDSATGEEAGRVETGLRVTALAYTPGGAALYAGHNNGGISRVDPGEGTAVPLPAAGHREAVRGLAFSPDGRLCASGGDGGLVLLWNYPDHSVRHRLERHSHSVNSVAFSPGGRTLASGTGDRWTRHPGEVELWEVATGQSLITLENLSGPVAFSPDGRTLRTTTESGEVWAWKTGDEDETE